MKLGDYYQDALRSRVVQVMVDFDETNTTNPWMLKRKKMLELIS